MTYTTHRYWLKYGNENDAVECTTKEWETFDKAVAYCRRYATSVKYVSCEILDENDNVLYEDFAGVGETFYEVENKGELNVTYTATKTQKGKKTFYEVKENGETIFTRNSTKDSFKFAIVFFNSKGKPFHVEYRTKMELGNPTFGRDCAHKFVEIEG